MTTFIKKVFTFLISSLVITGCGKRFTKEQIIETGLNLARPQRLAGGYTEQREPSEDEMELFKSATGIGEMVFTPLSVSTQVVAGINYKFWCRYQEKDEGGHCWVVIYKPLPGQGEPRVTSIEKD